MEQTFLVKFAATLGVAMIPVLELRAAVPFGLALDLAPGWTYLASVIGNMIPIPAILLFLRSLFQWLRRWPWWERKIVWLEERAEKKGEMVRKYRMPGLVLLVAIPLPGTGAWTGALVATILRIPIRIALPLILLGVLIAGCIVMAVSFGVISLWI